MNTQFFVRLENFNDALVIYARMPSMGGTKIAKALPMRLAFEEVAAHTLQEPTLTLTGDDGRSLFQAMWDAGMRPNDGAGSGAEAGALKAHIKFAERVADRLLAKLPDAAMAGEG